MRISEGVLCGKNIYLYHPEMFQDHEEVIIFTREEFRHHYESIMEHVDYITKEYLCLNRDEDWKLLGIWPKMIERIYLIDQNMKDMLTQKPVQSYLDAYLFESIGKLEINVEHSKGESKEKYHVITSP